jgi:hypothetical protein
MHLNACGFLPSTQWQVQGFTHYTALYGLLANNFKYRREENSADRCIFYHRLLTISILITNFTDNISLTNFRI